MVLLLPYVMIQPSSSIIYSSIMHCIFVSHSCDFRSRVCPNLAVTTLATNHCNQETLSGRPANHIGPYQSQQGSSEVLLNKRPQRSNFVPVRRDDSSTGTVTSTSGLTVGID